MIDNNLIKEIIINIIYDKLGSLKLTLTYVDAIEFLRKTTTLTDEEVKKIANSYEIVNHKNKIGIPLPCKMVED